MVQKSKQNLSPWLHYSACDRPVKKLSEDEQVEVAITGAGIAGVASAYFLLKHTSIPRIALVEARRVAHGASGHNGGFLATYFERSFRDLVSEFGLDMASSGQRDMDSAWDLLDQMIADTHINVPVQKFTGYTAIQTKEQIFAFLEDNRLRTQGGLPTEPMLISDTQSWLDQIPKKYQPFYTLASHADILALLQSKDDSYIGLLQTPKGTANSAMLCEQLVCWMLERYPERFQLYEETKIDELVLKQDFAVLATDGGQKITAGKIVLCTNGFENFKIVNENGPEIDSKFHHLVRGIVGYMAGYIEDRLVPAGETSFLPKGMTNPRRDIFSEEAYFYLTKRPMQIDNQSSTLVCLGGPETLLEDTANYDHQEPYPDFALHQFNNFLQKTYQLKVHDRLHYRFLWHGLMGFTPNGVRLIGPEPRNPILLYNLGCNGVGLLPSIFGGRKIASFLAGEKLAPSMFDPQQ